MPPPPIPTSLIQSPLQPPHLPQLSQSTPSSSLPQQSQPPLPGLPPFPPLINTTHSVSSFVQQLPTTPQQLSSPLQWESSASPHDSPSTSSAGHQSGRSFRKRCLVPECPKRVAPTMWQSHMPLHARGLLSGGAPQTWLVEQDLFVCPHCLQLVANSRAASHSRQCKVPRPMSSAQNDTTQPAIEAASGIVPNYNLPSFADVCHLRSPTLRFVLKKARPFFTRALSSSLRSVLAENSEEAWLKLFMLPKCVLPSLKSKGRHLKHTSIKVLCDFWMKKEFSTLWNLAVSNIRKFPSQQKQENSKSLSDSAISMAKIGLHGKACRILLSDGLAPLNNATWELLKSKHPSSPPPIMPGVPSTPLSLGTNFNLLPILFSFPKVTAAGPSGLRVQHLIDAAQIPLPIPISTTLRDVVNLLAAGKAPLSVARCLAGGSLTALNKFRQLSS